MTLHWMQQLADHYEVTRQQVQNTNPQQKLMILFDIDGTILDTRYLIQYVLQAYDRAHSTKFFQNLQIKEIDCHEEEVSTLLENLGIHQEDQDSILVWYEKHRWAPEFVLEAHRPYQGVMEIIRWFMIQPNTEVGLNTARPERLRQDTLRSLNTLGKEYRVNFHSDKLFMNPGGWGDLVLQSKVKGIQHFESQGYRVLAFIDNEPLNLKAVAEAQLTNPVLLLHADTIFQSSRQDIPKESVGGFEYDLSTFIGQRSLPKHIQFVWQGLQNETRFRSFVESEIFWVELPVRQDLATQQLIVREESFAAKPMALEEEILLLEEALLRCQKLGRGVKLNFMENGPTLKHTLNLLEALDWKSPQLWFHGDINILKEKGFYWIRERFPKVILQSSIDFLGPLVLGAPEIARGTLAQLKKWGLNRFALHWGQKGQGQIIHLLQKWNCELHLTGLYDLETFLQASLQLPNSISINFSYSNWSKPSSQKLYELGLVS